MNAPPSPGRAEVRQRLLDLLGGRASREDIADWASTWVTQGDPAIDDLLVWNALRELAGVDLKVNQIDYLHGEDDFHEWLDRVEAGDDPC